MTAPPSPPPLAVRPREGPWWRAQRGILHAFLVRGAAGAPAGAVLKTDGFDEASGPHHHAADLPAARPLVIVDADEGVLRRARARLCAGPGAPRLVVADVRRLPIGDAALGVVVSLSTLDHLESAAEIGRAVGECFRVLRPGGRLLLTLDNPRNPEVALRAALPRALVARLRADAFPLGATLGARRGGRLLAAAGFAVQRTAYVVHAARYPGIRLLAWLERRGWGAAGERAVAALEALARWPTRSITGHYVAWVAVKPGSGAAPPPGMARPHGR